MKKLTLLSLMTLLLLSCDPASPFDDGWALFEEKKYPEAVTEFTDRISDGNEAYVGLGWSSLKMDSIQDADDYFNQIATDSLADAYAGWMTVKWVQRDYVKVIEYGDVVLSKDEFYLFSHDNTANNEDILLHQAYAYYAMRNLSSCISKLRQVDSNFSGGINDPDIEQKILNAFTALGLAK